MSKEALQELIKDTDYVFRQYPSVSVKSEYAKLLYNGNPLKIEWITKWQKEYKDTILRIYDQKQSFIGIYQWNERQKDIRPIKIFMD